MEPLKLFAEPQSSAEHNMRNFDLPQAHYIIVCLHSPQLAVVHSVQQKSSASDFLFQTGSDINIQLAS
jgi:hypothetical protein